MATHLDKPKATLILDIGKTHAKVFLYDDLGEILYQSDIATPSLAAGDYLAIDTDGIWRWFLEAARKAAEVARICAVNISTHGACAIALKKDGTLAFPVLDYEHAGVESHNEQYERIRPPFSETLSPALPAGLNLGRQLHWLKNEFSAQFSAVHSLLLYPQYWVWRMTGQKVLERTSLGCHTDLWDPVNDRFSSLPERLDIESLFPRLVDTRECVANVSDSFTDATNIPPDCRVYAGVHDSNASLARYIASDLSEEVSVVSNGTWIISMALNAAVEKLDEMRDTLANVSVTGSPVACARFMGGREFERICNALNCQTSTKFEIKDIQKVLTEGAMVMPGFSPGTGPFPVRTGEIDAKGCNGAALATVYVALMIDYELDLLGSTGDIVFGSASSRNPVLCQLIAALRPSAKVMLSGNEASTPLGAWCLTRWNQPLPRDLDIFASATKAQLEGFHSYRKTWRQMLHLDASTIDVIYDKDSKVKPCLNS